MNIAQTILDDLKKMFGINYMKRGDLALISHEEKRDIATVFDLNEHRVKEAVLRRVLFLFLVASVAMYVGMYFDGKAHGITQTARILIASISAVALVFLYLDVFVPVVLLAACASLLAICWMDYQAIVAAASFSALYALYFFARLRAR
ncbi:hypothetical protein ACYG9Z_12585 [Mesorhizobium sp. RSR380A]|uniref:hypothetical protein n=1 Tax=unclassified Mesorhizobium TaxID=325217 RepID=UPI0004CF30D0|nr:hypothetical protein [Mesorhizobium sp. LNJC380A00]